ncbi:alpha-xylosidase YicI [Lapidilactobacillus concavus DSM 17758]|uniref:alpha-D-xyloside xylohydrolase n=1 Tax=Lapidilactobacillus concavus DSM 17758 TaxID=1423735 RepID=A0A0R1VUV2_9LACO|nr:alpha-xylosidase [Lapidilactobacillus concavus]KRM09553.1 alpha-xylosidase YicI [Lapidilactobacillus concavus DSM 17758]GEL13939.1 alpha-xylosidase [Lapidilactobacillus concavus]
MKFLNGGWLVKDGYDVKYAQHIYDVQVKGNKLILYAPFNYIDNMGATLDGGLMTIEVTSPRPDVITTQLYHYHGEQEKRPTFELNTQAVTPEIEVNDDTCTFVSGKTKLVVSRGRQIDFKYYYDGKLLTESTDRAKALVTDPEGLPHISEQLVLNVGEKIYGLGERFTNFIKNGQTVDIYNADGGTGTEQAYKNIPFYISNRNYGVFVDTPGKVSYEIGSEKVSRVQFSVPAEELTYSVIGGADMKGVLENYTGLTGKPALPPAWTFGLWLSTSFTTDYDEKTVNEFVDGMIERDIPLSVFHFDCLWMRELEWCNFVWDERKFPEPEKMLKRLKAKGLRICVWLNSYIGQKSPLFEEGKAKGYFIKKTNGDVWQWDKWQAGMAIVDFTNPEATAWYQGKMETLLNMGVDCFKTDFGERIPTEGVQYFDGSDPELMHNYYTLLYNKAVYDVIAKVKGEKEAVVFARSATVGSQKYPVHWGGDNSSNYPSMAESLRAGLSFGMSGFGYWAHDISGFEAEADPDIYKRWTQFGLLSSHSRYHGSNQYKVPWLYGEEAVEVSRKFTKLKLSLLPYLMAQAHETHETGVPMMRSMILEFTNDRVTEDLDRQYMLGDSLLVAPIFNTEGLGQFYVPNTKGNWISLLDGKVYQGGKWYEETYDYMNLPLLVRPNTVLIQGQKDNTTDYDYTKAPTIHLYNLEDGDHERILTDTYGQIVGHVQVTRKGQTFKLTSDCLQDFTVKVHEDEQVTDFSFTGKNGDFDLA